MAKSAADGPPTDAVRAQMARILASESFLRSRRLARFLEFTVEETLAGRAGRLKEYAIGLEVFGRKPDFDPQMEAIVRVQAVSLRARLAAYYGKEGLHDPILIEYNKGSYVPVWKERGGRAASPSAEAAPGSIAVLPFVNMSSDPENEYFSDGLTEELISAISNLPGLRVVARTSVFQYKGKPADVRQIGAELNAGMVLEGSVRKDGNRLCITAQLVDARNGYESWSRTYRVEMKDVFNVQHEIAEAIAGSLRERAPAALKGRTGNLEAYHAYLKGRFHLNKWTEDGFRRSIEYFETSIGLDPKLAAAHCGLADAWFVLACYGKLDPRDVMPRARAAAQTALDLGAPVAEAHVSLGAVRAIFDWDWSGAEREFQQAIASDPNCATAYQWYGVLCLLPQGRLAEAEAAIRRARDLDPLSPPINTSLGLVYFVQARYDEAIGHFERALEINPQFFLAHWWMGVIYLSRSMLLKAYGAFRKAGALSPGAYPSARFTYREGLTGRRDKARRNVQELESLSRRQYVSPVMIAAAYVVVGEKDAAIGCLERACLEHDAWLAWLQVDRRFDPLRGDPRFVALLNRIGIGDPAARPAALNR